MSTIPLIRRAALLPDFVLFLFGLGTAILAVAVAAATTWVEPDPADDEDDAPPCESEESPPEVFYACLRTGTLRERAAAAALLPMALDDADALDESADRTVDDLLQVIRHEPDDWVSRTLLAEMAWIQGEAVDRLYREALREDSVNLRAEGFGRLAAIRDREATEALEGAWKRDLPAWARRILIAALAFHRSAAHRDAFIRLTRDADEGIRLAAIDALGDVGGEEGRPALLRAARGGGPGERAAALKALARLPVSEETLPETLRASRAPEAAVRLAAVGVLVRLRDPEGDRRLIALLEEPAGADVQAATVAALADSTDPEATAALVRFLAAPATRPDSCPALMARRALYNRDDRDAAAGLRVIAGLLATAEPRAATGTPEAQAFPTLDHLIAYLSRDDGAHRRSRMWIAPCPPEDRQEEGDGEPKGGGAGEGGAPWRVAPDPPFVTIRCWQGPDLPGDPADRPRIPAGTAVRIVGHFERPAVSWVAIEGDEASECWVPLTHLAKGSGSAPAPAAGGFLRCEFDMRSEDLASAAARSLAEAGLLDVIEPGEEVAGAALTLDPADPDQVALLDALATGDDRPLDEAMREVLERARPAAAVPGPFH